MSPAGSWDVLDALDEILFFEPQLSHLSETYRTVAFNFRGHGRSEKTEAGHTVRQYALDVDAFLKQRAIDDVILVGWSLGALVARP